MAGKPAPKPAAKKPAGKSKPNPFAKKESGTADKKSDKTPNKSGKKPC